MAQDSGILATLQQGVQAINQLIQKFGTIFPVSGGTATTASGGSATLPSNPVGFIVVTLPNGTAAKVPFYE